VNKKQKIIKVADVDTGEIGILITETRKLNNSNKRFIKIYYDAAEIINDLNYNELKVFLYIIFNLKMNRRTINLKPEYFTMHRQTYYKAINGLIQKSVIKRHDLNNIYYINNDMYFNGKI